MRWVKWDLAAPVGGLLVIQLGPYGGDHDNPPVVAEPSWDSARTRELAVGACFHGNETVWPRYSNVAPISVPPRSYLLTHPDARLTDSDLAALANGLAATFGDKGEGEEGDSEEDD